MFFQKRGCCRGWTQGQPPRKLIVWKNVMYRFCWVFIRLGSFWANLSLDKIHLQISGLWWKQCHQMYHDVSRCHVSQWPEAICYPQTINPFTVTRSTGSPLCLEDFSSVLVLTDASSIIMQCCRGYTRDLNLTFMRWKSGILHFDPHHPPKIASEYPVVHWFSHPFQGFQKWGYP